MKNPIPITKVTVSLSSQLEAVLAAPGLKEDCDFRVLGDVLNIGIASDYFMVADVVVGQHGLIEEGDELGPSSHQEGVARMLDVGGMERAPNTVCATGRHTEGINVAGATPSLCSVILCLEEQWLLRRERPGCRQHQGGAAGSGLLDCRG